MRGPRVYWVGGGKQQRCVCGVWVVQQRFVWWDGLLSAKMPIVYAHSVDLLNWYGD
jgi:hypothetical protein